MRLTEQEKDIITRTIYELDSGAIIRLFGSRTDPDKRGGDIDLLVLSMKLSYRDKLQIRASLKQSLGNRKIDIIITDRPLTAFAHYAFKNSILL